MDQAERLLVLLPDDQPPMRRLRTELQQLEAIERVEAAALQEGIGVGHGAHDNACAAARTPPRPLPEIPVGAAGGIESADDWSAGGLERASDPHGAGAALPVEIEDEPPHAARTATPASSLLPPVAGDPLGAPEAPVESQRERDEVRPSSRRGGAILLTIVAVMIAAVVVIAVAIAGNGGRKGQASVTGQSTGSQVSTTSTTATKGTSTTGTTGTGPTTSTATTSNRILAQLNLHSPNGAKQTAAIVDVARVKGVLGMVIYAQGVPANGAHNAYAVWLYNSPTSHHFVGFVPNLVGKDGKLVTC